MNLNSREGLDESPPLLFTVTQILGEVRLYFAAYYGKLSAKEKNACTRFDYVAYCF